MRTLLHDHYTVAAAVAVAAAAMGAAEPVISMVVLRTKRNNWGNWRIIALHTYSPLLSTLLTADYCLPARLSAIQCAIKVTTI